MKTEMVFKTLVSTIAEPHYPADSPKNFFTSIVLLAGKTSNCVKSHIVNFMGRTTEGNKPTQLTTNQRAGSGPENRASTGINTGLGHSPDPHQLNDPEDENRDGL
jgi:hypothetical protein